MPDETKKNSSSKREFEIEIPASEVTREVGRVLAQYSSRAKIRGFRQGKAPQDMIKRMYYADIQETVINNLVPPALNKELSEKKVNPVGSPIISDLHFRENEPLRFKATVEIWPEIHLPEYKGIKIKKLKTSVTEKEIKDSLEGLRMKSAQYIPVEERGVIDGDYVVAEIKGKNIKTKKFLPTEKVVILAGHQDNEKTLNEKILGLMPGKDTQFTVAYKKDHDNKKLAGQEIEYVLEIESIKEKKLPEINDDFAKDLGDYKNLKDLKTKLKEQLHESKKSTQRQKMAEEIMKKVSEKMTIDLPESVIEHEFNSLMERHMSSLPRKNVSKDALDSIQENIRQRAVQNIKNHLILNKIAEKEKLSVSEEEMKEEMKAIAKTHSVPLARVVESINQEGQKEELEDNLLIRKTVDFLVKSAIME
jgi:trigger factor